MNPSKRKGTQFETDVVIYLRDHGFPNVERRALRGNLDCGDIAGIPDWVLECKATRTIDLAGAIDEAESERFNMGARYGAAVIKRRGKGDPGHAYVVQTLEQWVAEHQRKGTE